MSLSDKISEDIEPVEAYCGECEDDATYVPVVRQVRGNQSLAWRCTACGRELK